MNRRGGSHKRFKFIQSLILVYLYGFSYKRPPFEPEQSSFVRFIEQTYAI